MEDDNVSIVQDLRDGLQPKGTSPIVKLQFMGSDWFEVEFVQSCVDELERKALSVAAGLEKFSPLDQLALHLLKDSAKF